MNCGKVLNPQQDNKNTDAYDVGIPLSFVPKQNSAAETIRNPQLVLLHTTIALNNVRDINILPEQE